MSLTIEELKRRILLKKQLVEWTQEDIRELEKRLALAEVERDEKPCKVWDITGGECVEG